MKEATSKNGGPCSFWRNSEYAFGRLRRHVSEMSPLASILKKTNLPIPPVKGKKRGFHDLSVGA